MKVQSEFRVVLPKPMLCEEIVDRIAVAFHLSKEEINEEVNRIAPEER